MGRTCGSCGGPVPVLADGCPACGADPEVGLVDVGALAPIGRRSRPAPPTASLGGPGGPDRPRRRPWPVLGLAAIVVVVAVVLLSAPEDAPEAAADDEPRATTTETVARAGRTDRSTTTTAPTRPHPAVPGSGLLVTAVGARGVLHLDTGHELPVRASVVGGHAGRLLVDTGASLAWWPPPFDGTDAELLVEGSSGGPFWIDPADGGVWAIDFREDPRVRFIGPDGATTVDLPAAGAQLWPGGVAGGRLIVSAPGGTFAIDRDGATSLLSTGALVAAGGDAVAVNRCDEQLVCRFEVLDPSGVPTRLPAPIPGSIGTASFSSTGLLAALLYSDEGVESVLVGGAVVIDDPRPYVTSMTWSPDGRHLVVGTESRLLVVEVASGVVHEVDVEGMDLQRGQLVVFDAG